ncbi:MAG: hypothetical protein K0S78_4305 [Thermomicrobiales bacterium]|jgi:hypothetical protein|nr:hypothetical protein [Thermomicrobiales bacterium]
MSEGLDDLARQMASGASRRRLLGLFGGAIAGSALAMFARQENARAGVVACFSANRSECAACCREEVGPGPSMGLCMRNCIANVGPG